MSWRLPIVNLTLRLTIKWPLSWLRKPEQARRLFDATARMFFHPPEGANFTPSEIPARWGRMPAVWASCGRPDRRRVILYLHGGAYIMGSPATHRHLGAVLAREACARVLLPDYRLAPEHPFPAAVEDAVDAYRHLLDAGYAPAEIAVAGDSAGGGLSFALLLALQAEGLPRPAAVVGFSPWCDMTMTRPSIRRNARREVMIPVSRWADVLGFLHQGTDPADPLASPALGRFVDPPPAMITASRSEALADDATAMAETLRAAGGDVRLEFSARTPHAWPVLAGRLPEANRTLARAGRFIADTMGSTTEALEADPAL